MSDPYDYDRWIDDAACGLCGHPSSECACAPCDVCGDDTGSPHLRLCAVCDEHTDPDADPEPEVTDG